MGPSERPSELELFVEIVRHVIRVDGFDAFLPTILFPARNEVRILDHLPPDVDLATEALRWALERAQPDEEYLVAFKLDSSRFKVLRCAGATVQTALFDADEV